MINTPNHSIAFLKFQQRFSTEEACEKYLFKLRWPKGFICPVCHDTDSYHLNTRRAFKCKRNGHQTFLTAETVMHGSRTPMVKWFGAAYLLATAQTSMSALKLQRQLGIRYETAFNILHKLRASMVKPPEDKIYETVEMDYIHIGGPTTRDKRGRGAKGAIVILAVEDRSGRPGRIRLRHVKDLSERSIVQFIRDSVEGGSIIRTDKFRNYGGLNLKQYGYKHETIVQPERGKKSRLPLADSVFSELKRWIREVHHGVSQKHLQAYLNEYAFFFNNKFYSPVQFHTLLGLSPKTRFPTYRGFYDKTEGDIVTRTG